MVFDPCPTGVDEGAQLRDDRRNADLVAPLDPAARLSFRRWRFADLSSDQATARFDELGRLAAAVATPELPAGTGWVAEDWPSRRAVADRSTVVAASAGGAVAGFMLVTQLRLAGSRAIHLQAAYVRPELQGQGVAFALNARMILRELARRPLGSRWIVMTVYNPLGVAGWRRRLSSPAAVYPSFGEVPCRPELVQVATAAAGRLYPQLALDVGTGVLRARTGPRPAPPRSGDDAVDRHFEQHVDAEAGDTLLMVLDGRRAEVLRCLRTIPGALVRSVAPAGGSRS